ncbi:CpaE-like family protein [Kitasatospora sp. RB6PN24]|uniref:septum site-determining protein Ssd n=1 Tax=Kitasatospora humi TaxID=2893891 RepID=UPI001E50ADAC|nr:septum site-determining protein Ssd [Kitasatospora humi]MCC9307540.1 CpaE-like family protein [Kitasatospora humi]
MVHPSESGSARPVRPVPLVLTRDEELTEHLLRLCAAVGTEPQVCAGVPPPQLWDSAPLVLVGDDQAEQCAGLTRRPGVLLCGLDLDDCDIWVRGVYLGAEQVLFLPDAQAWLLDRIADALEGVITPALTVAVLGGCGGAGASTLACALAVTAARAGHRTTLIDGDPLGGGLDVLLGAEAADGLRWPDLATVRGRLDGAELTRSLPRPHGLHLLSWDRGETTAIPAEAMRGVLAAARRRGGLVVVDLPRRPEPAASQALEQADTGLLVVPAELRAMAAARRTAAAAGMRLTDLRAVVRRSGRVGLDGAEIAQGLGLRLAGEIPDETGLAADTEHGRPPGVRGHGPLARFCTAYLGQVLPLSEGGTPS